MHKKIAAAVFALMFTPAIAAPICHSEADAMALKTAALQQEMMVAALVCKATGSYNEFVLSHRTSLQVSDQMLLAFFVTANPRGGFDDYNLFKTELANTASLRSLRDTLFCARAAANFAAAQGRTLDVLLHHLPHPAGTGPISCQDFDDSRAPLVTAENIAGRP